MRTLLRWTLGLIIVLVLSWCPDAQAMSQQDAQDVAAGHYGVPCDGSVSITWTHMGAGYNARSTWMAMDKADASTFSDCTITFNYDVAWDAQKYCTVMEHEYGHLTGHHHDEDAIMAPYYDKPSPECVMAAPWHAESKVKHLSQPQLHKRWKKMLKAAS